MKKNFRFTRRWQNNVILRKIWMTMKLTTFLLIFAIAQMMASETYSQATKLTFQLKDATLKEVLTQIEEKSEFFFLYNSKLVDVNRKVSVDIKNQRIDDLLSQLFSQNDVAFIVVDRQIILSPKLDALNVLMQNHKVTGIITDMSTGEPIIGANIIIEGTTNGTITDVNGKYSIEVPNQQSVLLISYIGYLPEKISVSNQQTINVNLVPDIKKLEEIVVIGYGTRSKRDVTTSISTVKSDAVEKNVSMSAELAMQGRMSGVQVQSGGGNPMARPTIRIRGVNTWGVATPLYIIDGVPVTEFGAGIEGLEDARARDVRGPLNIMAMIDPNDIESISVLKDASAAAIYGVRAANGVILITTKKGIGDKPVVEFSSRMGFQNVSQKTNLMNTQQYTRHINEVLASDPTIPISSDNVGYFDENSPKYLGNSPTYNWQDAIKNKNAPSKDYSLRVSGGTGKTDYFISVGSTSTEGAFKYNYLDRLSGSFKLNTKVNNWLNLGANYRITTGKGRDSNPGLIDAGLYPAWQPIYDPNGPYGYAPVVVGRKEDGSYSSEKIYGLGTRVNTLGVYAANDNLYKSMRNMGNLYAEIEPVKHLKIKGQVSMDVYNFTRFVFNDYDGSVFDYTAGDMTAVTNGNSVGSYDERDVYNNNIISELTVNYSNSFGKHNLDIVLNGSDQQYTAKYRSASTLWMQSKADYMRRLGGESKYVNVGSDMTNSALEGLMARASYNYNSVYYLDLTLRHDGSTRFAPNKRWGTFPSVSGAWRISSEPFMKNLMFIDDLKLRAGYGQLGNQEVRNMAYLSPIDNRPSFAWGVDETRMGMGNRYLAAAVYSLANADLQWEKTSTVNIGFDATFLRNKLTMSFEYFNKLTDGILQTVTLPLSLGLIDSPVDNIASVRNTGIELSLNYNEKVGELNFNIGANFSTVKNTVEKTSGHIPIGSIEEGYSMNYIKGYKAGGIFQNQAELDAWMAKHSDDNYQTAKVAPGDYYFLDQRSAPTKPNTFYSDSLDNKINSYDQVYLGKTIPGFYYGLNLNLDYKGLDLSAQFTGVGDVQKVNYVKMGLYDVGNTAANMSVDVLNAWTPDNKSTSLPRVINGDPAQNYRFSDRFVESGAYLRLSNLQLGYTLPKSFYSFMRNAVSNCRVYAGASNLFTITRYSGYDPENDSYPTPRTIFLGLNVRF
jgi:TonB-dependent starch-binding outer membrane protein SusC